MSESNKVKYIYILYTHLNDLLQMSYLHNIALCVINLKSCWSLMSASLCFTRGANRGTNKAAKANNEPIINTLRDISQPLPLSLQTGELRRVCLLLRMLMTMMRAMMEMTPAPPIPSTRACSSAPAITQTEYIFTPRYRSLRERLIVHIGSRLDSARKGDQRCFTNDFSGFSFFSRLQ